MENNKTSDIPDIQLQTNSTEDQRYFLVNFFGFDERGQIIGSVEVITKNGKFINKEATIQEICKIKGVSGADIWTINELSEEEMKTYLETKPKE